MMHLPNIPPLQGQAMQVARARQAVLTKPPGALGRLEALSIQLAGITGNLAWLPNRRALVICAGDHGVTAQGISAYPQAVTAQMVQNFLAGGAAANVLAKQMNTRVRVVDAGVAADFADYFGLFSNKIGRGTADISIGPAMSELQAEAALVLGLSVAQLELAQGLDILAVGEMGIGNTTAASCIIAALTGHPAHQVTGRGTGLDEAGLAHKIAIVEQALAVNKQPSGRAVLAAVGGFEIGAMAGLMIGAAAGQVPVLVDGLISTAAALIAAEYAPEVKHYLLASHKSVEPGHVFALQKLGLTPLLDLDLRLGEGTGAVLAMPIVEAAMRTLQEMATFGEAGVSGPA
jgi:nicotinate-nucleotide--dimethylbenzimidazole phosphoribosyltransferase